MELFEIAYVEHHHGNQVTFTVGLNCDELRKVERCGEYTHIPWVEVWSNGQILAEFNQHKLYGMFYRDIATPQPQGEAK